MQLGVLVVVVVVAEVVAWRAEWRVWVAVVMVEQLRQRWCKQLKPVELVMCIAHEPWLAAM